MSSWVRSGSSAGNIRRISTTGSPGKRRSTANRPRSSKPCRNPAFRLDYLFGKVWLRKRDAGVLKIQWSPSSIENYEAVEREAQRLGRKPDIVMTSEYAFEKNGIRFPSRYTVKENYLGRHGGHFMRSETVVLYDQYKFFTVETDVKF